jgi:ATP phosphoribosyltransferase
MNVPKERLEAVVALLPSLNAPTVAHLYQSEWLSVETVVDTSVVRDLIPELLSAGAEGIIEYPLNKVVHSQPRPCGCGTGHRFRIQR